MLLSSVSLRARCALGAGIVALVVGSAVVSLAGTSQAVDSPVFTVSATAGSPGDKVTLSGTGCNPVGPHVGNIFAYQGVKSVPVGPPPTADGLLGGSTMVADDGTWSFIVDVPQTSGVITWVANCGAGQTGTPNFWYGQAVSFKVTGSDETTTTEATTTTTTTTAEPGTTPTTTAPSSVTTAAPTVKAAGAATAVTATPAYTG